MRSCDEILFRVRQEISNALMLIRPPAAPAAEVHPPLPVLPDPASAVDRLRTSTFAAAIEELAERALEHRFCLLGTVVDTGPAIAWRRDYSRGTETGLAYFRFIPYLDLRRAGDFKIIFELNRHQHLVLLAQAFLLTGRREFLDEVHRQLDSWIRENPFQRGINWASALEVAFRALSWIWIFHWTGGVMPQPLRARFLECLYRHGSHIEANFSTYFSPNTHLVGEAVALHLLGRVFPEWPRAAIWERKGHELVVAQMHAQVRGDGGYFEQSLHYHVYAMDFFLLHKLCARQVPPAYDTKLERMGELLDAIMGCRGSVPLIGDDDGGRVFHPYGRRDEFGRATLAAAGAVYGRAAWLRDPQDMYPIAAWWIGDTALSVCPEPVWPRTSVLFRDTGLGVLHAGNISVIADAGSFGPGAAAHSHSDTLSITAYAGKEETLIESGTYTYVDPAWRDRFRGTAAHNTVRVGGRDQAQAVGMFRWARKPDVRIRGWEAGNGRDYLDAECRYGGAVHRRAIVLLHEARCLFVLDYLSGLEGEHVIEQFWHPGVIPQPAGDGCYRIGSEATLRLAAGSRADVSIGGRYGWRSRALGQREAASVIRVCRRGEFPAVLVSAVDFSGRDEGALRYRVQAGEVDMRYGSAVVRLGVDLPP